IAAVLDEAIRAGATVGQLVGIAHADQVGGDAAASWLQVRQDVAPKVRRGGIAVQQHDGVALSQLHVRHLAAEDSPPLLLVRKCRLVSRRQGHRHAHEGTPFRLEEPRSTKNAALRGTSAFAARRLRTEQRAFARENSVLACRMLIALCIRALEARPATVHGTLLPVTQTLNCTCVWTA